MTDPPRTLSGAVTWREAAMGCVVSVPPPPPPPPASPRPLLSFAAAGPEVEISTNGTIVFKRTTTKSVFAACAAVSTHRNNGPDMVAGRHFAQLCYAQKGLSALVGVVAADFDPWGGGTVRALRPARRRPPPPAPCPRPAPQPDPRPPVPWASCQALANFASPGWLLDLHSGQFRCAERARDWPGVEGGGMRQGEVEEGDVVGLLLDLDAGSLVVFLNGRRCGTMIERGMTIMGNQVDWQGLPAAAPPSLSASAATAASNHVTGPQVAPLRGPLRWVVDLGGGSRVKIHGGTTLQPLPIPSEAQSPGTPGQQSAAAEASASQASADAAWLTIQSADAAPPWSAEANPTLDAIRQPVWAKENTEKLAAEGLGREDKEMAAGTEVLVDRGVGSRRRDCHFADTPSQSILKRLLKGERGAPE